MSAADEAKIDPAVVAALYQEHGEELFRFVLGVLRDAQLASDVIQAALVKMVEQGHTARVESRKAWLFRVAYHEALAIRRRQAVGDKVLRKWSWTNDDCSAAADVPLLRDEVVQSVREAIEQLPAEQRQIVELRIYEEKTFAVIAEELGIPLGTALGRMRTATKKLRKMLEERR